ncbi:hypothetical protein [Streptomyces aidingensis]|uniref:WD40-like Beta Propeller Repeat n=1 Tax=Streptomyces aidingensis TaxID=910347 RepID=A0A1I1RRK9_9ACTN|nr:hypothetical protein [Streptomyces aidingensis]SFD34233.1 hypothetical protein SAMN05421773_113126 [Streptomyces aidingensis]
MGGDRQSAVLDGPAEPLCAPGDLDHTSPLPGRPAVPQRILSVAASRRLGRVAVATSAPWFTALGELLVLEPLPGPAAGAAAGRPRLRARPPLRLPLVRGPYGAVVRDLVLDPDGSMVTASLGGAEEQHVAGMIHWALEPAADGGPPLAVELWRHSASRTRPATDGDAGYLRLAVSRDGRTVAGCDQNSRNVTVLDSRTGRELFNGEEGRSPEARIGGTGAIALDADGSRVAFRLYRGHTPAPDGGIAVLPLRGTGAPAPAVHPTGLDWCCGLAFSPEGDRLAVVGIRGGQLLAGVLDLAAAPPGRAGPARGWTVLGRLPWEARQQCARPQWGTHGPRVAVRSGHTVTVWDLLLERPLHSVTGMGWETTWNLTPDGTEFLTATPEGVHSHSLGPAAPG